MGPDPINADPRVLTAMSAQLIRQYDPAMTAYKTETMELYSGVFRTANQATRLVDWHLPQRLLAHPRSRARRWPEPVEV